MRNSTSFLFLSFHFTLLALCAGRGAYAQDAVPLDSTSVSTDSTTLIEKVRLQLVARDYAGAIATSENIETASLDSVHLASYFLYRGLSFELQRNFAQALQEYDLFLSAEPATGRSAELLTRYSYVKTQTVRSRARLLRDEGLVPTRNGPASYIVGGFPFYNASSILVMSQVSFGLSGVLYNVMGLLDHFSDQSLPLLPYEDIRTLLDEILPEDVYGEGSEITPSQLADALNVRFLPLGVLNEISGSLTADMVIGISDDADGLTIRQLQSSYTPAGLLDLQRDMALSITDSIQARLGFNYVPSREAFGDSLESYLIDDVSTFLTYGYAIEQLMLGNLVEAQAVVMDLRIPVARLDLARLETGFSGSTPPADNLLILTGEELPVAAVVAVDAAPDSTVTDATDIEPVDDVRPKRPVDEVRASHVASAAAARVLLDAGVWGPMNNAFVFDRLERDDPRHGVPGTLDPNRRPDEIGVNVKVVVPIPPAGKSSGGGNRGN